MGPFPLWCPKIALVINFEVKNLLVEHESFTLGCDCVCCYERDNVRNAGCLWKGFSSFVGLWYTRFCFLSWQIIDCGLGLRIKIVGKVWDSREQVKALRKTEKKFTGAWYFAIICLLSFINSNFKFTLKSH